MSPTTPGVGIGKHRRGGMGEWGGRGGSTRREAELGQQQTKPYQVGDRAFEMRLARTHSEGHSDQATSETNLPRKDIASQNWNQD